MLSILVSYEQKILHHKHEGGPIELGRGPQRELPRVPLFLEDLHTSRDQLRVEELPDGRVRLQNLSRADPHRAGVTVTLNGVHQLLPQAVWEGPLPVKAAVGQKTVITLAPAGAEVGPLGSYDSTPGLASPPPAPEPAAAGLLTIAPPVPRLRSGQTILSPPSIKQGGGPLATVNDLGESPSLETLARWMETVLALQRSSASPEEFYAQTTQAMIDLIGLDISLVVLAEDDGWREVARAARPELPTERPAGREYSHTILSRVTSERRTFYQDARQLDAQKSGLPANAVVASPIFGLQDDVVGALYGLRLWQSPHNDPRGRALGLHPVDAKIRPLEAQVVQLLAAAVSANQTRMTATRIERDLEIGRSIQASFLPRGLPQLPGWEVAAQFDPAREVSGDFYDVFPLSGDHLALVIADVCDKGVGAALFMTLFRSLVRAFARQAVERNPFCSPERPVGATRSRRSTLLADLTALSTVELTNEYVARTHEAACMFATLFFGVLDTSTGSLSYVNAGHDFPAVLGPGGVKGRLEQTGPAVGVNPDAEYDIQQTRLEPGETLFAYTDGVTEARSPGGEFFTEKRLLTLLAEPMPSATALLEGVIARLDEHVAGREPSDDVTLLAVRRLPAG